MMLWEEKGVSTLRARASSLMAFARWRKKVTVDATIFPVSEEEAYRYVVELRQLNALRTKASRFLESLTFAHSIIGADVGAPYARLGSRSSCRTHGVAEEERLL